MSHDLAEVIRRLLPEMKAAAPTHDRVEWLEANWERIKAAAFGSLEAELLELSRVGTTRGLTQILSSSIDLLTPLRQAQREVAHTQLLAYFLGPARPHGLGAGPLRCFLLHLKRQLGRFARGEALSARLNDMITKVADAVVLPELPFATEAGELGRTDLWIEFPRTRPENLLVIEMKVGMPVSATQLQLYDGAISRRLAQAGLAPDAAVKVILSYEYFSPRPDWFPTSWRNLAAALAPTTLGESEGALLLKFYLATLLKELEGLTATPQSRREQLRLRSFLRLATRDVETE